MYVLRVPSLYIGIGEQTPSHKECENIILSLLIYSLEARRVRANLSSRERYHVVSDQTPPMLQKLAYPERSEGKERDKGILGGRDR